MRAHSNGKLANTRAPAASAAFAVLSCRPQRSALLHRVTFASQNCRQRRSDADHRPVCLAFNQLYTHLRPQQSAHRARLGSRRVVTAASSLADSSLEGKKIWQWRKAQLHRIAVFTGPALSIPLADPIMSLVDTVCVGQFTGTLELAALGPTMLIFNLFTYLFTAITITTVSLVTDKLRLNDVDGAGSALSSALFVATICGLLIQTVLLVFSRQMVLLTGAAPALVSPSVSYLQIRAWSAPAVLISMVAQAGLLAQQDSFVPFIWVAVQSVLNIVGDLILIMHFHLGLQGAAWATVVSQLVGTLGLLLMFRSRGQVKPKAQLPTLHQLKELFKTFGPASLIYVFKSACYMMLQGSATALRPLLVAGHQVLWQIWNLCAFAHTPMEQAALAFLPGITDEHEYQEYVKLLLGVGVFVGVITSLLAAGVPSVLPHLFTPDQRLWPIMKGMAPQIVASMMLCAVDTSCSGVLMAGKDLMFLAQAMTVSLVALGAYFSAAKSQGWQLGGIWWGLVLFFFVRAAQSGLRLYAQHQSQYHIPHVTPFEADQLQSIAQTGDAAPQPL